MSKKSKMNNKQIMNLKPSRNNDVRSAEEIEDAISVIEKVLYYKIYMDNLGLDAESTREMLEDLYPDYPSDDESQESIADEILKEYIDETIFHMLEGPLVSAEEVMGILETLRWVAGKQWDFIIESLG